MLPPSDVIERPVPTVDPDTLRAARRFLDLIGMHYSIRDAYLFGSRARGTHRPDSDADIAVVLRGEAGNRGTAVIDMAGLAYEVFLDLDIRIQVTPLWEAEFDRREICSNPTLVQNVRRDGVRL